MMFYLVAVLVFFLASCEANVTIQSATEAGEKEADPKEKEKKSTEVDDDDDD